MTFSPDDYLFPPAITALPLLSAQGESLPHTWPVNRVFCIGRNYADHAREMGHDPSREPPFYFSKPSTALFNQPATFPLPSYSSQVEYEVEVVIGLTKGGKNLSLEQAKGAVGAIGIGLDMTCRDRQKEAKTAGRPWDLAKGFDHSAPVSPLQLLSFPDISARYESFNLTHNGRIAQQGQISAMIWSIPELIVVISQQMALCEGDIIMTGTPAGVGPVSAGDTLIATLEHFPVPLTIDVVAGR